jgi:TIR domain
VSGHIFISYSHHRDKAYVESLAAYLKAAGVPAWYDVEMKPGDRFSAEIQKAIDDCAVFMPVLTPASAASEWVRRELSRAVRLRKPILPLLRGACDPPVEVEGLHHEDVSDGGMPGATFVAQLRQLTNSSRMIGPTCTPRAWPGTHPGRPFRPLAPYWSRHRQLRRRGNAGYANRPSSQTRVLPSRRLYPESIRPAPGEG